MEAKNFTKALQIITNSCAQITVSFNVPVVDNYSHTHAIVIKNSNASVVKHLVEAGFSLYMTDKGLVVDKI